MGRANTLVILGFAILAGLAAVLLANSYLGRPVMKADGIASGTVKLAVAQVPMEFGAEITPDKVEMIDWPAGSVPEGAYTSAQQLLAGGRHVALRPMTRGEPILRSRISGQNGRATISAVLRPDMRAMAVRVNDASSVGGFALPGDVVDVMITRPLEGGQNGEQITDVLIQNVRVIAADQVSDENKNQPIVAKTVTLEVSQLDAQKLALAQQVGTISLALRRTQDEPSAAVETVSLDSLRDGAFTGRAFRQPMLQAASYTPRPPRPPRPKRPPLQARPQSDTIQVFRGTGATSYEVTRSAVF